MSNSLQVRQRSRSRSASAPVAARLAAAARAVDADNVPSDVIDKVKTCLFDLIGCAFESRELAPSRQATGIADRLPDGQRGATIIGQPGVFSLNDAAFANAVMGHGLVREDMHTGSVSHLGVVVLPSLFALAEMRPVSGRRFVAATMIGYEVGGQVGRAVIDAEVARIHRPTGVTGPLAAAAAGAYLMDLDEQATTSAIAFGANTTVGYNQWAHTGGSEMFFHVGFAARNGITAVRLASQGAFVSPSALEGEAGLFAALGKPAVGAQVRPFRGAPEILSVYHKPVPACNYAQTASQAAVAIGSAMNAVSHRIAAITVRVPRAAAVYPGCDSTGPFEHVLQAKMSIQFNVAAALIRGSASEQNFSLLKDPELHRLLTLTRLEVDDALTRAYPAQQGAEVEVREFGGIVHRVRRDDVVNATPADVRLRFRGALDDALGAARSARIEELIDGLERLDDAGSLVRQLGASRNDAR